MQTRTYVNKSGKSIEPRTSNELVGIAYRDSDFADCSKLLKIFFDELDGEKEFVSNDKDEVIREILDRQRELGMTPRTEVA